MSEGRKAPTWLSILITGALFVACSVVSYQYGRLASRDEVELARGQTERVLGWAVEARKAEADCMDRLAAIEQTGRP